MMQDRAQRALVVVTDPLEAVMLAGAAIATLIARGGHVTVLTCLSRADTEDPAVVPRPLAELGVEDHRVLGRSGARRDGLAPRRYVATAVDATPFGLQPAPQAHPDALCRADAGEVAADVATVVLDVRPDVIIGYDEWGGDRHPDRIRVHEAARRAAEVMAVPYYAAEEQDAGRRPTVRVDPDTAAAARKAAALAAVGEAAMDAPGGRAATRAEHFTRLRRHDAPERTGIASVLAGALVAFLAGAGVGALGTISHQSAPPVGIILALLAVAGLLVGLRLVFGTRTMSFAASVGVLGAAALFALPGGGGSVLVPENPLGYVWTFGPVLIALFALGWPRIARRPTP